MEHNGISLISCDFKRDFCRSQHGDTLAERMVVFLGRCFGQEQGPHGQRI